MNGADVVFWSESGDGSISVGSTPPPADFSRRGRSLVDGGWSHIVLCARERQRPASYYPGARVVHCPFEDDDTIVGAQLLVQVHLAAQVVAEAVQSDHHVLVCCLAGINRSALVAALAMQFLGLDPHQSVEQLRERRFAHCLSNTAFERVALRRSAGLDHFWPEEPAR